MLSAAFQAEGGLTPSNIWVRKVRAGVLKVICIPERDYLPEEKDLRREEKPER